MPRAPGICPDCTQENGVYLFQGLFQRISPRDAALKREAAYVHAGSRLMEGFVPAALANLNEKPPVSPSQHMHSIIESFLKG